MNIKSILEDKLRHIKLYTPAIGWGVFVLVMSLLPTTEIPGLIMAWDDFVLHMGVYVVLTSLLFHAEWRRNGKLGVSYLPWILISFSYGILIEIAQVTLTTYRTFSLSDILANGVGILVSFLTFRYLALPLVKKV